MTFWLAITTDYRYECVKKKVDLCEAALVGIDRYCYHLEKTLLNHGLVCYSLAVKLLQSLVSFANTKS